MTHNLQSGWQAAAVGANKQQTDAFASAVRGGAFNVAVRELLSYYVHLVRPHRARPSSCGWLCHDGMRTAPSRTMLRKLTCMHLILTHGAPPLAAIPVPACKTGTFQLSMREHKVPAV